MSRKEFKYDAFISYRHAELDSFVAELLHKQLESFKVPRLADKEIKETGKQGIKRVFRDKDELPLAGNLSAPITEAFPPQLCTMKQKITAEDGTVAYEEKAIVCAGNSGIACLMPETFP